MSLLFLVCYCTGICNFKGFCEVAFILMLALLAVDPVQGRAVNYSLACFSSCVQKCESCHIVIKDKFLHVEIFVP